MDRCHLCGKTSEEIMKIARDSITTPDNYEKIKKENSALANEIKEYNDKIEDAILSMEILNGDPSTMNQKARRIYELSRIPSGAYCKFRDWDSSKYQSAVDVDYPFTPEEREMLEKVKVWLRPGVTVSMAVEEAKEVLNYLTELSKKKPRDFEAEVMDIVMKTDLRTSFSNHSVRVADACCPNSLQPIFLSVKLCPICNSLISTMARTIAADEAKKYDCY